VNLSRRTVLLTAIATPGLACSRHRPTASSGAGSGAASDRPDVWGGLSVIITGRMRDDERGGTAVVLLHGWGAPGDDLVGLGQMLERPSVRFVVPAAPLVEVGGGRAWWHLDSDAKPEHAADDQPPKRAVRPDLLAARLAVQTVLKTVRQRYAPDVLCIAGFSQGAMLALDVALDASPPVDRVAALSGVLLADSVAGLRTARANRPVVFVSHGRSDPRLPFRAGERAKDLLQRHGFNVSFHPFDGGHEIPPEVVNALRAFLFAAS
jgi:phospholipase/carboxylesterase